METKQWNPYNKAEIKPVVKPTQPVQNDGELDKDAVNLAKAIRQVETGNQQKPGATGEMSSRYQFLPTTWKSYAKEILGDENAPINLENENKVAYTKIKSWKDQGYNVGQVASMWNAGEGRPNAYKENWRKVDENGNVLYDTPAYAEKVANEYQRLKAETQNQVQYNTQPSISASNVSPMPVEPGEEKLGTMLRNRIGDASSALSKASKGEINPVSGALQIVGAGAGAFGDLTNEALRLIPGYKGLEKLIGKGVESLINTEAGKGIVNSMVEFAEKNPELAKDMEAGFNIATALPMLKGLKTTANMGIIAISKASKNTATKNIANTLEEVAKKSAQKSTQKLLNKNKDVFKNMVKEKAIQNADGTITKLDSILPDIEGGKYITKEAYQTSWDNINKIEDNIKKELSKTVDDYLKFADSEDIAIKTLDKVKSSGINGGDLVKIVNELDPMNKTLWEKFTLGETTLQELNQLRSALGQKIGSKAFDTTEVSFKKEVGKKLYDSMSSYIKKEVPSTESLFKEASQQFQYQDALNLLEGKNVKTGFLGTVIKTGSTIAGEGLGNVTGIPMVGALTGYQAGNLASKGVAGGLSQYMLKKSALPIFTSKKASKIGGLLGASLIQKQQQKNQSIR